MVGEVVEGMPWLRHLPRDWREDSAPPRRDWSASRADFTILGVDDQIRLLKQLLEAEKLDEKRWPAQRVRA